ncbi:MAG: polysaccharide pyruvyl transferase family protein [Candidatus Rokuibacteriota bacterium]
MTDPGASRSSRAASPQLFRLFEAYRSTPFLFVESGGNFGDELIWLGAYKLARVAGLDIRRVTYDEFVGSCVPPDTGVYVHGGGGINPWCSGRAITTFQKALATDCPIAILGPQSVHPDHAFLRAKLASELDQASARRTVVFARDHVSYEALAACFPGLELGAEHDTALHLSRADLDGPCLPRAFALHVIREDNESNQILDRDLLSLSIDPTRFCRSFNQWVALHRSARRIVTNRLHSAIAGVVLGKPTVLLPNSYHKTRSVWVYSLRERGVVWSDEVPLGPVPRVINAFAPLRRLMGSNLAQTALRVYLHRVRRRSLLPLQ